MRDITIEKLVNVPALDRRLRERMADKIAGISFDGKRVTIHLLDTAAKADEDAAKAEVAAHDPTVKTEDQTRAVLAEAAKDDLLTNDFKALKQAIEGASTLAALRPILLAMLLLMWKLALAQGLTRQTDVDAAVRQ
jgi:hypothetical protein